MLVSGLYENSNEWYLTVFLSTCRLDSWCQVKQWWRHGPDPCSLTHSCWELWWFFPSKRIRDSVQAAPVKLCGPYQGSYMVQEWWNLPITGPVDTLPLDRSNKQAFFFPPWAFYLRWKSLPRESCKPFQVQQMGQRTPAKVSMFLLYIPHCSFSLFLFIFSLSVHLLSGLSLPWVG